jgi:uncharacterized protein YkwD
MRLARGVSCVSMVVGVVGSGCGALGRGLADGPAGAPLSEPSEALPATSAASNASDPHHASDSSGAQGEPYPWQAATRSPQTASAPHDELAAVCAEHDAALDRVAAFVARRELAGGAPPEAENVTDAMRAEGAPYVWPHLWVLAGGHLGGGAPGRFRAWLDALPRVGEARCGTALARSSAREVAVGVAVDVLADVAELPTEARVGAWLDLRTKMLVPTSVAEVLVLGPGGAPHSVPTSLEGDVVRARVHADREGSFLLQVLATVDGGPRPVAEALVFAGAAPTTLARSRPAPGENVASADDAASLLAAMVNGARASEELEPLVHDRRLDRIAQAHAEVMRDERRLAHEGSDGSPADRLARAGISASAVGENLAHAADVKLAHRTLWQSPSHRQNLLETRFDALGVGVAADTDQTLWVCEVFAKL